ncbi:hypothetical protein ABZ372_41070, partial [Streptomyces sp. NPDC005921]
SEDIVGLNPVRAAGAVASSALLLAVARQANQELNQSYGVLKRLQNGVPREGDSTASARDRIDHTRELLHELRHTMRCDLGVTEPSQSLPS